MRCSSAYCSLQCVDVHSDQALCARVTKYSLPRIRLAQLLIPFAFIASVWARRQFGAATVAAAIMLQLVIGFVFLGAIKRLGKQPIRIDDGTLWIGTQESIPRAAAQRWTRSDSGVTVYSREAIHRLCVDRGSELDLETCLRQLIGEPTKLRRRGSPRARIAAVSVACVGLGLTVSSFTIYDSIVPIVIGIPSFVFGIAAFGALSQRVTEETGP